MDNLPKFTFKKDAYMKKRGNPAMLLITCAKCSNYVMHYQKDGPGPLLRCYLDRIHHPESLKDRQNDAFDTKASSKLTCDACHVVLGVPMIYEKEKRPAYHMRPGFFHRKKQKNIC